MSNPISALIPGDPVRTVKNLVGGAGDLISDAVAARRDGEEREPLPTVESVDPQRYAGRWYELARLPMRFQKDSTVSVAEYSAYIDGSVGVHNVTYQGDELGYTINGVATPAKGAERSFARLRVKFGGIIALAPVAAEGNYWILALAEDYSLALVGTPDRRYLWLLARDPAQSGSAQARQYVELAAELGFDTSRLLYGDWTTRTTRSEPVVYTGR